VVKLIDPTPSARAVPIILFFSAIWLLAARANIFNLYTTVWPILAFAALWVGLGLQAASRFALPLGFLYFAIPVWDFLQPPLQAIATAMMGLFTYLLGIPAVLDGNYITLPTQTIFVAEDCSGAYFLCISLAIGVLAGVVRDDTPRTRILILVIFGFLSMAFNWLRILIITLAYLHSGMNYALDWMGGHVVFGWWIFAFGLLTFSLVLHFIPRSPRRDTASQQPAQKVQTRSNNNAGLSMSILALVVLPVIASALPSFDHYPMETPGPGSGLSREKTGVFAPDLGWRPHYPGAVWEERLAFATNEGAMVEVYGNRFHEQTQGNELISGVSYLFDYSLFSPTSSQIINLEDAKGQPFSARRDILTDSSGRLWVTLYTYLVDNDPIANSRRVQLTTALRSVYSRATVGVIAVASPCVETCDSQISDIEDAFMTVFMEYREIFGD